MYLRILRGNLRKKKGQSISLAILFCISLALLITSVRIYNVSTSQIDAFVSKSKIASLMLWKGYTDGDEELIEKFAAEKDYISSVNTQDVLLVNGDTLQFGSDKTALPSSLSVFLTDYDLANNLVFASDTDSKIILEPNSIAIPVYLSDLTGAAIGDTVAITNGKQKLEFTVQYIFKDALFGSEYISTKRVLLNHSDLFRLINGQTGKHNTIVSFNLVDDSKIAQLLSDYSATGLDQQFSIDKNLLSQIYLASNGMIAVVFLIAAVFISLICFIVQRYSVITTLQYEYKQIALMKAIGIGLKYIKRIYLVKYCFIGLIGLLGGLCLGQLLFSVMTPGIAKSIVIVNPWQSYAITVMCSVFTWTMFAALAYIQMNRIKRFTPIELANLQHSERKSIHFIIKLHRGNAKPCFALAINDIVNKPKTYLKYTIALSLCFSLVLVLNNLKMTIQSHDFINYFGLTVGDIYTDISVDNHNRANLIKLVDDYNELLLENGEKVTLGIDFYKDDTRIIDMSQISSEITALKSSSSTKTFRFIEGTAPLSENEIALTTVLMKRYQKEVGDIITLEIDGIPKEYRITASYQALFNMGEIILLPDLFEVTGENVSYQVIAYVSPMKERASAYITYLQNKYEFLRGATADQIISRMTGNMVEQIAFAINLLIIIMFIFLCLIALLFTSLICFGEAYFVRTIKAMGINKSFLLSYQCIRVGAVILCSLLVSVLLSVTVGRNIASSAFAVTGLAKFELIIYWSYTFIYLPFAFALATMCLSAIVHISDNKKQSYIV